MKIVLHQNKMARVLLADEDGASTSWGNLDALKHLNRKWDHAVCLRCMDDIGSEQPCIRFQAVRQAKEDAVQEACCCLGCIRELLTALSSYSPDNFDHLFADGYHRTYGVWYKANPLHRTDILCLWCGATVDAGTPRYQMGDTRIELHPSCIPSASDAIHGRLHKAMENRVDDLLPTFL